MPFSSGRANINWPSLLLLVARRVRPFFLISTRTPSRMRLSEVMVRPTRVFGVLGVKGIGSLEMVSGMVDGMAGGWGAGDWRMAGVEGTSFKSLSASPFLPLTRETGGVTGAGVMMGATGFC